MQSSSTSKYQALSQKNLDWSMIRKIYLHKKSEQSEALANTQSLLQIELGCMTGDKTPGKICYFFFHLNWHKIVI